MDKAFVVKDLESFECSSPSELDKRFYDKESLLAALSLDQLSTSRMSNESVAIDVSDARLSILASLCTSLDPMSPSQALSISNMNDPDVDAAGYLTVPMQGKSSTPQLLVPNQKKPSVCDQSYTDLNGLQISWDVSIIKSESPKVTTNLSAFDSPKPTQQSQSVLSP